jgi:hypothetical protein
VLTVPDGARSNILACHVKSCNANNFPLLLSNVEIEVREAEYNEDFLKGFWPKIEWQALVDTAKTVSPASRPTSTELTIPDQTVADLSIGPIDSSVTRPCLRRLLILLSPPLTLCSRRCTTCSWR